MRKQWFTQDDPTAQLLHDGALEISKAYTLLRSQNWNGEILFFIGVSLFLKSDNLRSEV